MFDEEREEIERLLDDLEASQLEDGSRTVMLPCGVGLRILFSEESSDLYAEAVAAKVRPDGGNAACFRDLATMNFFWRELDGFTAALRGDVVLAETREDMSRLGDEEVFRAWLMRADGAVRTIREVMSESRTHADAGKTSVGNESDEVRDGEEVRLWP